MNNPYLNRTKTQNHGTVSERRVAKKVGARISPASGAMEGAKGDSDLNLSSKKVKIESKSTIHDSMALQYDWLLKIHKEARDVGAIPALTVSFVGGDGRPRKHGDWVLVSLTDWHDLLGE